MENKKTFAERHPNINMIIAILFFIIIAVFAGWFIWTAIIYLGVGIKAIGSFLQNFVSNTDKFVIVAMISGTVSIIGLLVTKILEFRYNRKKYLFDKREKPYEQFISMIYKIMEDTKKTGQQKMTEDEMIKMVTEFSKGLTLWGSNRVVKKWLKYRRQSINHGGTETLILLEDIIYEIRKDVGLGRRLKQGDMLSFFINDVENLMKK